MHIGPSPINKYPNDVYMTCTWYILIYRAIYHPQLGQLVSWLPQIANISKNTGNLPCFWGKNLHLVTYHVFFSSGRAKSLYLRIRSLIDVPFFLRYNKLQYFSISKRS